MKAGDLIRDTEDNEIGLVLSNVRSYSYIREGYNNREYVLAKWPSYDEPSRVVLDAVKNGWIEIVSKAEETTNR